MNNEIIISNIPPQDIIINEGGATGITTVYVNGEDVTIGNSAYVVVPTKTSELVNDSGFITHETDPTVPYHVKQISISDINKWNNKQDQLVSGVNIKTINSNNILGSGNLIIDTSYTAGTGINIDEDNVISNTITSYNDLTDLPTIPTKTSDLTNDSDFVESIELSQVAFSGDYDDLLNKPSIPTLTSDLENDSGFITNNTDSLVYYYTKDFLYNLLPKVSGSGTSINLANTYSSKLGLVLSPSELSQASTPTPSTPQDIHTISGSNTIKVEGSNLLNRTTCIQNKSLVWSDGTEYSNTGGLASDYIKVRPNENYYINLKSQIMFYDSNKVYLGNLQNDNSIGTNTGKEPNDFTIPNDNRVAYIRLGIRPSANSGVDILNYNIMLNVGTTALTYEPYIHTDYSVNLGDIEYCKIGDYSDRIFKNVEGDPDYDEENLTPGLWYIKKNIGKVVLDGTEAWNYNDGNSLFYLSDFINYIFSTFTPMSNYYEGQSSVSGYGNVNNKRITTLNLSGNSRFILKDTDFADTTALTTWLSTHNTIVYYVQATPTYTQIEDTLEDELENIYVNAESYTGQTNISQVNDDLPFTITATTLKDISNT